MNIAEIPFNQFLGLRREPEGGPFAVSLPAAARRQLETELAAKRAVLFALRADVFDEAGAHLLTATIEWLITRR